MISKSKSYCFDYLNAVVAIGCATFDETPKYKLKTGKSGSNKSDRKRNRKDRWR